jgi:hypothetical protein
VTWCSFYYFQDRFEVCDRVMQISFIVHYNDILMMTINHKGSLLFLKMKNKYDAA